VLHLLHALVVQVMLLVVVSDGTPAADTLGDVFKDISDPVLKAAPVNQIKQQLANVGVVQGLLLFEVKVNVPCLFLLLDRLYGLHLIYFDCLRLPYLDFWTFPVGLFAKVTTIELGLIELPKELGSEEPLSEVRDEHEANQVQGLLEAAHIAEQLHDGIDSSIVDEVPLVIPDED
jgi:hypothetical protein